MQVELTAKDWKTLFNQLSRVGYPAEKPITLEAFGEYLLVKGKIDNLHVQFSCPAKVKQNGYAVVKAKEISGFGRRAASNLKLKAGKDQYVNINAGSLKGKVLQLEKSLYVPTITKPKATLKLSYRDVENVIKYLDLGTKKVSSDQAGLAVKVVSDGKKLVFLASDSFSGALLEAKTKGEPFEITIPRSLIELGLGFSAEEIGFKLTVKKSSVIAGLDFIEMPSIETSLVADMRERLADLVKTHKPVVVKVEASELKGALDQVLDATEAQVIDVKVNKNEGMVFAGSLEVKAKASFKAKSQKPVSFSVVSAILQSILKPWAGSLTFSLMGKVLHIKGQEPHVEYIIPTALR